MNRKALAFVDAFPEPVLLLSPTGEFLSANGKARALIKIPESLGTKIYLQQITHDDDQKVSDVLNIWSGTATPTPSKLTFRSKHKDVLARRCNGWRWLSEWGDFLIVRVPGEDQTSKLGELTRTIDRLNAECTARETIERELRYLLQQINRQNSVRDLVLSQVSHDLRTPLNAILGISDFMLREPFGSLSDRYISYLEDIRFSGRTLLELVDKVLAMSLDSSVKGEAVAILSDLDACIQSSLRVVAPIALHRKIELIVPEKISLPSLKADQVLVKQILTNLLGNAAKHIPEGGQINVEAFHHEDGGVEVCVVDNGPGIPAEALERIFDFSPRNPFVSGSSGAGVGLSLSRKSAESMGAKLEIASRSEGGTKARLYFPPEIVEYR